MTALRVGVLGGSFNPAHAGHLHISLEALRRLRLHEVWWLVSPQNPLKSQEGMAPFTERVAAAKVLVQGHRHIRISEFEAEHGLYYTCDTVRALKQRYPHIQFVWLMGADNLKGFHRWQHWRSIFNTMPMAIFDRAPFSHTALHSRAALSLARWRVKAQDAASLPKRSKGWVYLLLRRHPASSTAIRAERNGADK